jgi:hypothetical protein
MVAPGIVSRQCLWRSQTRIDLLFTMSEIPHARPSRTRHAKCCFSRTINFGDRVGPSSPKRASPGTTLRLRPAWLRHAKPKAKRGGARRDRTDDLMLAKHALSQLSYGPEPVSALRATPGTPRFALRGCATRSRRRSVVGLGRLELPTSRLSSARSNQLSYKPLTRGTRSARTRAPALSQTHRTSAALARVRPRRKRNEDGEIPPMQLNDPDDRWPLMFLKRSDRDRVKRP